MSEFKWLSNERLAEIWDWRHENEVEPGAAVEEVIYSRFRITELEKALREIENICNDPYAHRERDDIRDIAREALDNK
jgi:hypothetical protein